MPLVGHRTAVGQWAALPLRLIVGYGFIAHGYAKVVNGPATLVLGGSWPVVLDRLRARHSGPTPDKKEGADDHRRSSL